MGLIDKLTDLSSPGRQGSDTRVNNTPEAWRPRLEVGDDGGYLVSTARPAGELPDASELLIEFGLDPSNWTVTALRRSRWQNHAGDWLEAARVSVSPLHQNIIDKADVEDLVKHIQNWKPGKAQQKTSGDLAFVFAPSDQQIGKKANGAGTPQTVDRILSTTEGAVHRLNELRSIGRKIGTVVIALPGDHVEGNVSQGGRLQSHSASDLGLTEQTRVARRLLMTQVKAFAPLADHIIVAVVNGNHDEVSRQVALDPSEGWNTEIASSVQDACAENSLLSHVEFRYPAKDHQTLAVEVCGTMLGLFHGHQAGRDVMKYIAEQSAGQTALGGCDVWLSGHYHNYRSMDVGSRFWAQCPTIDPGSAWFRDRHGLESNSGVLTMVIGDGYDPRQDVSIIPAEKRHKS
jgi:predicted phosphodiesterase